MIKENLKSIEGTLKSGVRLVAVSKYHPVEALQEAYDAGQRIFGESHVQELVAKHEVLSKDIDWHFIGHLQTNKVKYMASFVGLIHSVDSMKLLKEIDKQGKKVERTIDVLLQLHVATEETKFGLSPQEVSDILESEEYALLKNVRVVGLMAMATNTDDDVQIAEEFERVRQFFYFLKKKYFSDRPEFKELSMGMSGDYLIAQEHESTLVRVGSSIFGERNYE
ncbi:MAG: YggS family pyridoxal phosphate-dependent enzyme [Bacteroidaceae bacterium]|jgi:pyridoxal phosphate enzyme (YggS family)|nr:YggS family pyridoxal phosphate-dependent enzyme [Bacteroidaceae bacterium]